jgi:surface antigen
MFKKRLFMTLIITMVLAASSSLALAGSITQSTTNFKKGDKYYNKSYLGNCVLYARWLQPKLPYGLNTLAQKKAVINSSKLKPKSVAILDVYGNIGHVAYVADVDDSGKDVSITIYEANFPSGVERKRVIKGHNVSIKDLEKYAKIFGYYKP